VRGAVLSIAKSDEAAASKFIGFEAFMIDFVGLVEDLATALTGKVGDFIKDFVHLIMAFFKLVSEGFRHPSEFINTFLSVMDDLLETASNLIVAIWKDSGLGKALMTLVKRLCLWSNEISTDFDSLMVHTCTMYEHTKIFPMMTGSTYVPLGKFGKIKLPFGLGFETLQTMMGHSKVSNRLNSLCDRYMDGSTNPGNICNFDVDPGTPTARTPEASVCVVSKQPCAHCVVDHVGQCKVPQAGGHDDSCPCQSCRDGYRCDAQLGLCRCGDTTPIETTPQTGHPISGDPTCMTKKDAALAGATCPFFAGVIFLGNFPCEVIHPCKKTTFF